MPLLLIYIVHQMVPPLLPPPLYSVSISSQNDKNQVSQAAMLISFRQVIKQVSVVCE